METMIWRSAIVAGYGVIAVVIGIAYGLRGLEVLLFFYFWAGAWVAFILVWGHAARAAGRWNYERTQIVPEDEERDHWQSGHFERAKGPLLPVRSRPVLFRRPRVVSQT
jgi:hypothetical protein